MYTYIHTYIHILNLPSELLLQLFDISSNVCDK